MENRDPIKIKYDLYWASNFISAIIEHFDQFTPFRERRLNKRLEDFLKSLIDARNSLDLLINEYEEVTHHEP